MVSSAFIYSLIAGILPSIFWLGFWLREDKNCPEPKSLITVSFLGGAVAVLVAIIAEKFVAGLIIDDTIRYSLWAILEEVIKFIVVAAVALSTNWNDEPIDAMIYCVTVALGFAALENTLFIFGPLSEGDVPKSIIMGNMRFIGATLVHVVSSAMVGFAIGLTFYKGRALKFLAIVVGLIVAILMHSAFNLSIIDASPNDILKAFGWMWVATILLIIFFEEVKRIRPQLI